MFWELNSDDLEVLFQKLCSVLINIILSSNSLTDTMLCIAQDICTCTHVQYSVDIFLDLIEILKLSLIS